MGAADFRQLLNHVEINIFAGSAAFIFWWRGVGVRHWLKKRNGRSKGGFCRENRPWVNRRNVYGLSFLLFGLLARLIQRLLLLLLIWLLSLLAGLLLRLLLFTARGFLLFLVVFL